MPELNIAITSVGRRLYLVEWFKAAMKELGVTGHVVVADGDPQAPGLTAGDSAVVLPPFSDPSYGPALLDFCSAQEIGLLVSLNDYEASVIASGIGNQLEAIGTLVTGLPSETASCAIDKWESTERLSKRGVLMPSTWLGSQFLSSAVATPAVREIVVKHRFGSASSGLLFGDIDDVVELVGVSASSALDGEGQVGNPEAAGELVIVQERIRGDEFGVDALADFDGRLVAAFARRKIRMRAGETDRAVTVRGERFRPLAAGVVAALRPRGLIDMDVLVDAAGHAYLIDVNPRFGGGYPFSHLAGANAPACYIGWLTGAPLKDRWLRPAAGVSAAKFESITTVASSAHGSDSDSY